MKKIYLYISLLFLVNSVFAQDPNNHWKLGASDLNFSTNPPTVSTVTSGGFGSASISDDNGDLLFYTDGKTVWNKNHLQMQGNPYGIGYGSSFKMTQKAIIVPHPGNSKQYYVFTTENEVFIGESTYPGYSYRYFLVDFSDPTYPLGKVVAPPNPYDNYLKDAGGNQILYTFTFRPLTLVKNASNDGYFLIGIQANSATSSTFLAYKITSTGLNLTPIESIVSNNTTFEESPHDASEFFSKPYGIIKFSPDNNKLGVLVMINHFHLGPQTYNYSSRFFTLNFNNSTGTFSGFSLINDELYSPVKATSDFEFSADSQKVYFIRDKIYVKNLSNLLTPPRDLADYTNSSSIPLGFENIQRDKYGSIWVSSSKSENDRNKYLHKIIDQNSFSNSSVQLNSIYLNNNTYPASFALPQLIPSFEEPCFDDVLVTSTVYFGTDKKQAVNRLTASNIINSNAGAIYHAGTSIKLSNGFHAKAGSKFRAYIEGCSGEYAARVANVEDKEQEISENKAKENIFKLFPNPNKGIFEISAKEAINEKLQIQIYSIYGELMQSKIIEAESITKEFNVSSVPAGIYFVKIMGTNFNEEIKFVKE